MRLRKTLKRTAAATLALGMALSAAAPTVSAAYVCDVSQGSVNIVVNEDGNKSIQVNGEDVTDDGDGTDDIIITGDNTQAAASQNDTEETASAAEGSENTPSEDGTDQTGSAKETGNDKGSDEPAAPEQPAPTTAPAGDRAAEPPAKPETTVTETKDGTVINYGVTEADPDVQAEKPVVKAKAAEEPASDPAENEPDDKIMTYEAPAEENTSVVSSVAAHVVKIVNNCTDTLNIILRNLKVDAGSSTEDAMNISGTGDVTLELDGKNELTGGSGVKMDKWNDHKIVSDGLGSTDLGGTLTITGSGNSDASLIAKGADSPEDSSSFVKPGDGLNANNLVIKDASVTAIGGNRFDHDIYIGYSGDGLSATDLTITGSTVTAKGGNSLCYAGTGVSADVLSMTGSSLSAVGGNVSNSTGDFSDGGIGLHIGNYRDLKSNISDSHISAIGGNCSSSNGKNAVGGVGVYFFGTAADGYLIDHVTLLAQGGNAQASGSGNATGGRGIDRNSGKITISDSAVTVAGGNAVSESGTATGGGGYYNNVNYYTSNDDVHLVSGSLTAVGGSGSSKNGSSFDIPSSLTKKYYISDGETLSVYEPGDPEYNIAASDRLVVSEDSGIVYYNHSAVVQNEDGSVTVTGEPFRYVRGGHVYTIASRTDTTIIWHCEDEGVEDLELPIPAGSTFDAMKHEWVTSEDGTYEECTICHLQRTIPQPEPGQPDNTAAAVPAALHLRVVDANGADVTFETRTESGNYIVDARRDGLDTATLIAPLPVLRELQASGAESITFVTNLKTTTLSLSALLALGSEDDEAQLLHTGDVPTLTVGGTVHNELL